MPAVTTQGWKALIAWPMALIATMISLALLAGFKPADVQADPPEKGPDAKASDMGLVSAQATAFLNVRINDWLATPAGKIIREELLKDATLFDADIEQSYGVKGADMESVTAFTLGPIMGIGAPPYRYDHDYRPPYRSTRAHFTKAAPRIERTFPDGSVRPDELQVAQITAPVRPPRGFEDEFFEDDRYQSPLWLITTNKAYSQDKVLAALAPDPRQIKLDGKIVWVSRHYYGRVVHFINERNYVFSYGGSMAKYLRLPASDKAKSALAPAFEQADKKHHVTIGFAPTKEMVKNIREDMPWILRGLQSLAEMRCGVLTFNLRDATELKIQLHSENEARAQKTERAAKLLMDYAALMMEENAADLGQFVGNSKFIDLYKMAYAALGKYSIERQGSVVNIAAKMQTDTATLETAAKEFAAKSRLAMQRARVRRNLRDIGIALHNYAMDHNNFPMSGNLSWRVALLPYLDQRELYDKFRHDESWDSEHNLKLVKEMPAVLASQGVKTDKPGMTFYRGFSCTDPQSDFKHASFFDARRKRGVQLDRVPDGLSNTLMVVEADQPVIWTSPEEIGFDPAKKMPKLGGVHKEGFHALFGDGAVYLLSKTIKDEALLGLISVAGKETVTIEDWLVDEKDRQLFEQFKRRQDRYGPTPEFDERSSVSPLSFLTARRGK